MGQKISDQKGFKKICDLLDYELDIVFEKGFMVFSEDNKGRLMTGFLQRQQNGEYRVKPTLNNVDFVFTKENSVVELDQIFQATGIKGFIEYIDEDENPVLIAVKAIHRVQKVGDKTVIFSKDGISTIDMDYEEIKSRIVFATS